jgi:hypothetical protein
VAASSTHFLTPATRSPASRSGIADTVTPFTFSTPAARAGVVYTQGFKLYSFDENCGTGDVVCKPV